MIQEAYVSFEVAKLLKEKGFNEYCLKNYWSSDKELHDWKWELSYNRNSDGNNNTKDCSAPTQAMAVAWLREVHKLHICIEYDHPKFVSDIFKMDVIDEHGCAEHVSPTFANCRTYEEAIDAALEYTLENLI